jgi:Mat/Ecp fimbriae major subunit
MQNILSVAMAGALLAAAPAYAATEQADSKAAIIGAVQFALLLDMDFGNILANSSGGTVELDPVAGTRTCTGVGLVCQGAYSSSRLELTGDDALVKITYDSSFNMTGPGDPIPVVPYYTGGNGALITLTGGTAIADFGATITLNPNQAAGDYTGTFNVTVDYQ